MGVFVGWKTQTQDYLQLTHRVIRVMSWKKGITDQGKTFVIEVHIREDPQGGIHSTRKLQDDTDAETVKSLPNGGLEHACFGLMQEAMRQEAMFQALLLMSEGKSLDKEKLRSTLEKTFLEMWGHLSESVINLTIDSISRK